MSCNNTSNINKTFIIESASQDPVFSACTALYTNFISQCSGDTVSFSNNVYISGSVSGTTFYGDASNLTGVVWTGNTSASCINDIYVSNIYGCSPIIVHDEMQIEGDFIPDEDNTRTLGTPVKRFREINVYSGTTSIWKVTGRTETPELRLGLDSSGNTRTITANNSIIQDDTLMGGTY